MDERIKTLAHNLVNYSCEVKENDKVYIHYIGEDTQELARQIIKEVYAAKGIPFIRFISNKVQRDILMECTQEQVELMAEVDGLEMSKMDCYIGIRGSNNVS